VIAVGGSVDDRLLESLAHDLRTPLSIIAGYSELLRLRDDAETRREAPIRIQEAARRLSDLVDEVLLLLGLETGSVSVEPEPIDLGSAVSSATEAVGGEHVHLSAAPGAGENWPFVSADPDHLDRMLRKLVVLACARVSAGAAVDIVATRDGGVAVISVSDSGGPVPDDALARLLEDPGQLEPAVVPEGRATGMNLYTARRLAELHSGSLTASSPPGGGLTVSLTLPLAAEDE
jgi:signal transduction histidine kinase